MPSLEHHGVRIAVDDIDAAADVQVTGAQIDRLTAAIDANPMASRVLVEVLRVTEHLSVPDALTVESLAYSALLAGPEFTRWLEQRGPVAAPPTGDEPVLVERRGGVLHITLHRPERHNAYAAAMRDALVDALEIAVADAGLRVVLRGAGRSFCTGGDLAEFGTTPDVVTAHRIRTERSAARLLAQVADRVTVEAHGACIGAGTELLAFAGQVVAAPRTFFRLPEVSMGLIPGAGGTVSLPRRLGRQPTAWLALTGTRVRADQALALGLVDEVR
jgi:hypothetical protein